MSQREDHDRDAAAPGPDSRRPDEDLPLLTRDQAAHFRMLVADVMGELGHEVQVRADVAVRSDGHQFGLSNLAAVVSGIPLEAWRESVRRHCATVTGLADRLDTGPVAIDEHLITRLVDAESLRGHGADGFTYAQEFAPGILTVLCVDEPEAVRLLSDNALEHLRPLGPALDAGLGNLSRMMRSDTVDVDVVQRDVNGLPASCTVLTSESVYVGSYPLCMRQMLDMWAPGADVSRGVMFAVPFRNMLAFQPVSDAASILGGLQLLAPLAIEAHHRNAGSLSPNVMLWEPSGAVTQLSSFDGTAIIVRPGPLEGYLQPDDRSAS